MTMLSYFSTRDYPKKLLWDHYDKVHSTPRLTLLFPRPQTTNRPIIPLIMNYTCQNHRAINNILRTNQTILDHSLNNEKFLENRILVAYRKNLNLRDLLTNSAFLRPTKTRGTSKCWKNCSTCPLINTQPHITDSTGNFTYQSVGSTTCLSTYVVYAIICKKCNKIYVGQTKNTLQQRLQHTNDIVN